MCWVGEANASPPAQKFVVTSKTTPLSDLFSFCLIADNRAVVAFKVRRKEMANGLATLTPAKLGELVQTLPTEKRAAFSKAAAAAARHLKDSRKNYAQAYALASAMVENWWHLGVELQKLEINQGSGMKKRSGPGENVLTLSDIGINFNQSARCQKLAEMSKSELQEWLDTKYDEDKYYLPTLRPAVEAFVTNNTGKFEWYTPPEFAEAARRVMGEIDLDPASCKVANENSVKAKRYFTKDDDGLSQEWAGRVWMNPPYASGLIEKFCQKLAESEKVSEAICLVNNGTETGWFHTLTTRATAVCFPRRRVRFRNQDLQESDSGPLQGQAIVYIGDCPKKFVDAFGAFGLCFFKVVTNG